jgi:hypothetical protein
MIDTIMVGDKVKLTGISRHGKNRVHENGEIWTIDRFRDTVHFSKEGGPWMHLTSDTTDDFRWVRLERDKNFNVEVIDD